jgi:glycosyltransferase involved in cell wall biosynthesis
MADELYQELDELAIQFRQLKQEIRRQGVRADLSSQLLRPAPLEKALESSWVNPHQPIAWPHWPPGVGPKVAALLKKVTRRLLRWYIDPLVEEQNAFNAAVAQSLETFHHEIALIRRQLEPVEQEAPQPMLPPIFPTLHRHRLRLAFFTPLSPLKTAIADHSEGLLPHMGEFADVDLYIDDGYQPTNPAIVERFASYNHRQFPTREYDAVLYAMGDNADFHTYIYDALQRVPGVVILHDTTLHRFMAGRTLQKGDTDGYLDEMDYAYGLRDLRMARQVLAGYGEAIIARYPLFERVVDKAQGIIVHNEYARRQILQRRPGARVACIGQHFFLPPGFPEQVDRAALRAEMGLVDRFIVASFGIFVPDKRLDSCLGAFARFVKDHPQATYLFVGNYMNYDLPGKIQALGLGDHVVVTGWLDPIRFSELMLIADIGVHFRYPHIGGTPFSPVRMLGLGVPTIVSDIAPLAGFPEGCCIKVPPDEYEQDMLLVFLELLANQPEIRQRLGENGLRFLHTYHDARVITQQYLAFIEQVVAEETKP